MIQHVRFIIVVLSLAVLAASCSEEAGTPLTPEPTTPRAELGCASGIVVEFEDNVTLERADGFARSLGVEYVWMLEGSWWFRAQLLQGDRNRVVERIRALPFVHQVSWTTSNNGDFVNVVFGLDVDETTAQRFVGHFPNLDVVRFDRFPKAISFEAAFDDLEDWETHLHGFGIVKKASGYQVCY